MYDIIIIGAGPAGLTAALYARRALKKVLVLEALSYGGQIVNTLEIDNYPVNPHISGFDFATNLYNQVKELGAEFKFEKVIQIKDGNSKKVITTNNTYETKSIIIATGCENRKLGIAREEELIGKGVSYCATCDGAFYKGKDVAIVGGGNTAIEDGIYLSNLCNKVYIIVRRDVLRADATLVKQIEAKENIIILYNSQVSKLNGDDTLESIKIVNKDGSVKNVLVSGIFIAIGRIPENEKFKEIIKLNKDGYIVATENCHTNIEGVYVAGDAREKNLRQLVTATSDGAIAATEAIKYLNK